MNVFLNFNTNNLQFLDKPNKIIVHCSATDKPHTIQDIHKWHIDRGFVGCGYHFFITKKGIIQNGRPIEYVGAHCFGQNHQSIGVCLEGEYEFTKQQIKPFLNLVCYIESIFRREMQVFPHNEFSKKTCPNLDVEQLLNGKLLLNRDKSL